MNIETEIERLKMRVTALEILSTRLMGELAHHTAFDTETFCEAARAGAAKTISSMDDPRGSALLKRLDELLEDLRGPNPDS